MLLLFVARQKSSFFLSPVTPVAADLMTALPRVSILLVTKNGARYLAEVLDGIGRQRGRFQLEEIIAVDSGSRDGSVEILREAGARVLTIPAAAFGHGKTRNLAASHAHGDYLVFLTQDATPARTDWLEKLLAPLVADPLVVGAYSRHTPRPSCHPMEWRRIVQEELTGRPDSRVSTAGPIIPDYGRNSGLFSIFLPIPARSSVAPRGVTFPGPRSSLARTNVWAETVSSKPAIRPRIVPIRSCITHTVTDRGPISGAILTTAPPCTKRSGQPPPSRLALRVCRRLRGLPAPTWPSGRGSGGRPRHAGRVSLGAAGPGLAPGRPPGGVVWRAGRIYYRDWLQAWFSYQAHIKRQ